MRKIILDHYFTAYINIKPKWIKQSHIRAEIIKLLQEIIGKNLHKFGHDNGQWFLDLIPKAQATKGKIDKLEFLKINNFCISKDIIWKETTHEMEEIFANHLTDKALV